MPKALAHENPRWEGDVFDPTQDVYAWPGVHRGVCAKRARVLRKRGVPLMPLHAVHAVTYSTPCGGALRVRNEALYPGAPGRNQARYAWFEREDHVEERRRQRSRNCYMTHLAARKGKTGRKAWLRERLDAHRENARSARFARTWARNLHAHLTTRPKLQHAGSPYAGTIRENLIQTTMVHVHERLYAAGYVPEGDGALSDCYTARFGADGEQIS